MTVIQFDPSRRAWIRLPSGSRLDLINPAPSTWLDSDLAIRLSRTFRWGGESIWPHALSVAQHSLTVLALRNCTDPLQALRELLHDGDEGFLMFDCISPLKPLLGKPFKDVGDRLMAAISTRYSLPKWTEDDYALHKDADLTAAASEAAHCAGWTHAEVRDVLGIRHPILADDPLAALYDCKPWEPWPSDVAASRFLAKLTELVHAAACLVAGAEIMQEVQ